VGQVACAFSDEPMARRADAPEGWIRLLEAPSTPARVETTQVLPLRLRQFEFTEPQRRQQQRVAAWGLHRFGEPWSSGIFLVGDMTAAVEEWRRRERSARKGARPKRTAMPPLSVLREHIYLTRTPTLRVTTAGQAWRVADSYPCDEVALATLMGMPQGVREAVTTMADSTTASNTRRLIGQSVHWGSAVRVARIATTLINKPLRTMAAQGAGLNILGAAFREVVGPRLRYLHFTEASGAARQAHDLLWKALAPRRALPEHTERAEEATAAEMSADLLLLTLRCAPFSSANRMFPKGVWGALRELEAVMETAMRSQPRVIIYENTHGLHRYDWTRREVEGRLRDLQGYLYAGFKAIPDVQESTLHQRTRVFYILVRQDCASALARRELEPR
jgi:hypothetical protein